ncbi:hypothetical protein D3C86_1961380 [compost metagenome]
MTARGTGGDVAGVEDVQVQAQVGQVEVHCGNLWMCVVWEGAIASKLAPTVDRISSARTRSPVGAGLPAKRPVASAKYSASV